MSFPRTVKVFAPAKVNLALHVLGQRADGYHVLDSLVAFAGIGDLLTVSEEGDEALDVFGPFADRVPTDRRNFIFAVARHFWPAKALSFKLCKNLPVASGIGGGSADAAACYRAIRYLQSRASSGSIPAPDHKDVLLAIGADVPMCVASKPARVGGIGEKLSPVAGIPDLTMVLVNPGVSVSTPAVFKELKLKNNAAMTLVGSVPEGTHQFLNWLDMQRNDLEAPAISVAPVIADVLASIRETRGCGLARMSGSGATCFGLYADKEDASAAAQRIGQAHASWWVQIADLDGGRHATPQLIRSTT